MLIWFGLFVFLFVFGIMNCKKKHFIKQASKSPMASTSTQIASSSSSSTPQWRYEVFLSFFGKDTRNSFTDHLCTALKDRCINVFKDDEKLERGKEITELLKVIQESGYAVAVISENYAFSTWCLDELAEIVQCMRETGRVLPIFYHVDPEDVKEQKGTFAEAFARHENNPDVDSQMMQKWRAALKAVASIAGWHVHNGPESIVVKEIGIRIHNGLSLNFSTVSNDFVGIESRVEEIMTLLSIESNDVRFLGIYGMGGVGKTTLSQVIYEIVSPQFDLASCFILDIRKETKTDRGLLYLQKQLISNIIKASESNIWNSYEANGIIANRLRNQRVFIVLDDVDRKEQLEALAKCHDWFGQGSRIIITTRDRHLLDGFVNNIYEVKVLNDAKALQLFSWKAFNKPHPEENYLKLSMDIVNYAQGLPLALKVFGSYLLSRKMDEWQSARDFLKENPNVEILDKLQISFDGLEDLEKKLFLDIACFFNGANRNTIKDKLESLGYFPDINIKALVEKSLLTISPSCNIRMHDLLQKMGQKIVDKQPGGRSRLWHEKDVIRVLKNDTGTDAIEGIVLKLPLQKQVRLNVKAFSKMTNLKMLEISNNISNNIDEACDNLHTQEWSGDLSNFMLSNELCFMEWWGYPFKSLPTSFQSDNLVELRMPFSCIKQPFDGTKSFDKLKCIDLSFSKKLIETPDFSRSPNLEKLNLSSCTSLSKFHPSIGILKSLKRLNLSECECINKLPAKICGKSLEGLDLEGCSGLNKLPDSVGNMTSLRDLYLDRTAIKELPLSLKSLSSLVSLHISGWPTLQKIPKNLICGMKRLEKLYVSGGATYTQGSGSYLISRLIPNSFSGLSSLKALGLCNQNLSDGEIPSDFNCLSSLELLNLSGNKFTRIPESVWQLSSLKTLNLSYCNLLDEAIPKDLSCLSSLERLNLSGNKFTRIPDSVAQLSHLGKLQLENCSCLLVLPKLPLALKHLHVKNCPSLELFDNQMDIDCSFVAAYIAYGQVDYKILHLHPRNPVWTEEECQRFVPIIACGPALLGSGILEWFNDNSGTNSSGTIQMHINLDSSDWEGLALFIVYAPKVHEHGNSNSRTIVCQFKANEVDLGEPLVLCAPEVPSVGPSRFWVYISWMWFYKRSSERLYSYRSLVASITTGNLTEEVKEFKASVVRHHDALKFLGLIGISPSGLDFGKKIGDSDECMSSLDDFGLIAHGSIRSVNGQDLLKKNKR